MLRAALLLACLPLLAIPIAAQTNWTGASSSSWNDPANWDAGVPDALTNAVIPAVTNQPSDFGPTFVDPVTLSLSIDTGASLTLGSGFDLTVSGNLLINGSLTVTSSASDIAVTGNWTNNGTFTNGSALVDLTGTGVLGGLGANTFQNLTVSGGTRTATAAFAANGDVTVQGGASLDIGAFTHTVAGSWSSFMPGVAVTGTGPIDFTGNGSLITLTNSIPGVRVSGGVRTVSTSAITGNLEMTGGQIQISDNATLSVSGNATLTAGTLGWTSLISNTVDEVLDVDGNVTVTATAGTTSDTVVLRCGGNWSSTSAFAPALGTFELDGGSVATVSGTAPIFPSLRVVSGTKTITAASTIGGDLTLDAGATLDTTAALAIAGGVGLGDATAAWTVGAVSHTIVGDLVSFGASVTGAGTLEFTGTGNLASAGPTINLPNILVSAGTRSLFGVTINGNLDMTGGGIDLFNNAFITVTGNATLSAGTLGFIDTSAGLETLEVLGAANISATAGTTSVSSAIECAGDWTSSIAFAPAQGTVTLKGGITNVNGANFPNLVVSTGAKTFTAGSTITGALTVATGATIDTAGALAVSGNVSLGDATSGWTLGAFTHTVGGSYTALGASATGLGTLELTGGGNLFTGGGTVANLLISGGTYLAFATDVAGNLDMTAGSLEVQDDQTLAVGGNASLTGGVFGWTFSPLGTVDVIDVAGDATVTAAAGSFSANSRFRVAGNWSSSSLFAPAAGLVELDGLGPTTIGGASPTFPDLSIPSGTKTVLSATSVSGDLTLASGAAIVSAAAVSVGGSVSLGDATASWDLGASTHPVAGSWASAGASGTGLGTVEFTADGTASTGGGSIANVLSSAGLRSMDTTDITGNLDLTAGILRINNDALVTVGGNATLGAGSLEFFAFVAGVDDVLDVQGNLTLTASAGPMSASSVIRVAGNWSSTAAYTPSDGRVELDGGTVASVGGTTPAFANLTVVDGSKTLTATASVSGDLIVQPLAAMTMSLADLGVGGSVLVDGSLDMGGQQATVVGDWTSDALGASVLGPGLIELTGGGQLSTGLNSVPQVLVSAGTRSMFDTNITGALDMTGGQIIVWDQSTVTVGGAANLSAGTLSFIDLTAGLESLDVAGDVTIAALSGSTSANTRILCAGNWSSDAAYLPASGTVVLDGGTLTTVGGASPNLANLQVASGTKSTLVPILLSGDLTVDSGASLVSGAVLTVGGAVSLGDLTASWDLAALTHGVAGDYTSLGASATGLGGIDFNGSGSADTGGGSIANATVSSGTRTMTLVDVLGNLDLTGGLLRIDNDGLVTVGGDANLSAGKLEWFGFLVGIEEVLDVQGNATVTAAAGATTSLSRFRVAGNWSSTAAFAPGAGIVELDGGTLATVSGTAPVLADLCVTSGTKTLSVDLHVTGSMEVKAGAALISGAVLDVDGAVTLGDATASWDTGVFTHTVGGDFTSAGASATGGGTLHFDGSGALLTSPGTVDNVLVSAGTRSAQSTIITGNLDMTGGVLDIQDNATVSVGGAAVLGAGVLSFTDSTAGAETLDVAGDATITCLSGVTTANSTLLCAGNYAANGAHTPSLGLTVLDGLGITTITGLLPDMVVALADLTVTNGIRQVANDITLDFTNATIDPGAELELGPRAVRVPGSQLTVDGTLSLTAGGDLSLGATAVVSVSPTGTLSMMGVSGTPASITGDLGGGYFLTVAGTIEAFHYVFQEMGAVGIVINTGATIAAAPNDMRAGTFDLPSASPGSVLLNISRPAPAELRYVAFKDSAATGTFNVMTVVPGAVTTFANSSGGFAGSANEFDLLGLIDWTANTTLLSAYTATAGMLQVTVDWTSTVEVDSQEYILERATNVGGPFSPLAVVPSLGPSSYQVLDTSVTAGVTYHYRLSEGLTHGDVRLVDQVVATPWGPGLPPNVLDVGPTGTFLDIQSAVSAATGINPIIQVAPGAYNAFTVTPGFLGTLRVYGDGTGPVVVDTTAQPVQVLNLGINDKVELSDLDIGSVGSPNAGVQVQNCLGLVVLDDLAVQGGAGMEGIRVASSSRVAVQRSATVGTPGLLLELTSTAIAGKGSLNSVELRDNSDLRTAELSYSSTVQPGSTVTALPGIHADVDMPEFAVLDTVFPVTLSGEPNGTWFLVLGIDLTWVDLAGSKWEMVNLADMSLFGVVVSGPLGPAGSIPLSGLLPPDINLLGLPLVMQMVVVHPTTSQRRWSNVASIVGMPQ